MSKNIQSFRDLSFVQTSITKRCNGYSNYKNVTFQGRNEYYPNVLLYDESKTLINPYDEMVMSLGKTSFYDDNVKEFSQFAKKTYINFRKMFDNRDKELWKQIKRDVDLLLWNNM